MTKFPLNFGSYPDPMCGSGFRGPDSLWRDGLWSPSDSCWLSWICTWKLTLHYVAAEISDTVFSINQSILFYVNYTLITMTITQITAPSATFQQQQTRNSSKDEIANVNFPSRRHRKCTTKYNRLVHKFRHRSTRLCVGTQVYQIQWNNAM